MREQRHLGAVEVLLDHDPVAGRRVGERRVAVVGDDDALAGGEAVVLDDVRRPELVERGGGLVGGRADVRPRGRDAGRGHHLLGERLGALEPGGLGRRAEAGDAGGAHGVGDPGDQRRLGPDHDQVDAEAQRPGRPPPPGRRQVDACAVATSRAMPGLPGAACTAVDRGVGQQRAHQGVLAGTADPTTRTFTASRTPRPARPPAPARRSLGRVDGSPASGRRTGAVDVAGATRAGRRRRRPRRPRRRRPAAADCSLVSLTGSPQLRVVALQAGHPLDRPGEVVDPCSSPRGSPAGGSYRDVDRDLAVEQRAARCRSLGSVSSRVVSSLNSSTVAEHLAGHRQDVVPQLELDRGSAGRGSPSNDSSIASRASSNDCPGSRRTK